MAPRREGRGRAVTQRQAPPLRGGPCPLQVLTPARRLATSEGPVPGWGATAKARAHTNVPNNDLRESKAEDVTGTQAASEGVI